jgi:uncharacterized protein (TIGR03118 family)
MTTIRRFMALGSAALLLLLAAMPVSAHDRHAPNAYLAHYLVSDGSVPADLVDPNLVNAWGITRSPTSPWWVANNGTGTSTLYTGAGVKRPLTVTVPGAPTGTVFNGGTGFVVTKGAASAAALFLFASEDGTISGWNPNVPAAGSTEAIVGVDRSKQHDSYKGLAIATVDGADFLYAADFHHGRVVVFDSEFERQSWHGAFRDRHLPHGYAPFGIQALNDMIFVTYAKQDKERGDEIAGRGRGFVDAFSLKGKFLGRVASRGALDAPWGVAWAPAGFGRFSGDLLVGNFGDGRINAYRLIHGHWQFGGTVRSADHKAIEVDGLWGIGFGNDVGAGPSTTLFFAAGPNDEEGGSFGTITAP